MVLEEGGVWAEVCLGCWRGEMGDGKEAEKGEVLFDVGAYDAETELDGEGWWDVLDLGVGDGDVEMEMEMEMKRDGDAEDEDGGEGGGDAVN